MTNIMQLLSCYVVVVLKFIFDNINKLYMNSVHLHVTR